MDFLLIIKEKNMDVRKMSIGTSKDVTFSNGILRSTKTIDRLNDDVYHIHDLSHGWLTAEATADETQAYIDGYDVNLNWY